MPDNIETMAYNRRNGPPWHGKGQPTDGLMTATECIRKAGLDWGVSKVPVRVNDEGGVPVPDLYAVVRTDRPVNDPSRVLGTVGEEYQPLQNWAAFTFFDRLVEEGRAMYETAGSIDGGRRIWLLASLPTKLVPVKADEIIPYLLLANGHDGKLMVHIKFTPVRVVCQNTLAMALRNGDGRHLALRHDRLLRRRLLDAAELLNRVDATLSFASEVWGRMASASMTQRNAEMYFRSVFGGVAYEDSDHEPAVDADAPVALSDDRDGRGVAGLKRAAMEDFESKQNRELRIDGTLWAAFNAAVWAVDTVRRSSRDPVDDLCLGAGARLKERALAEAERLLTVR